MEEEKKSGTFVIAVRFNAQLGSVAWVSYELWLRNIMSVKRTSFFWP